MMSFLKKVDLLIRDWNHKRIDFFRYWRVEILRRLLDKPPAIPVDQGKDLLPIINLGDLLMIRLDDKIGDTITSTGFIRTLLQIKTKGQIIILTRGSSSEIFKQFEPRVRVIEVKKGFFNALKALNELQKLNISVLINTSHILTPETMVLCTQIDSTVKISFGKNSFQNFTHFITSADVTEHVTAKYDKTLKLFSTLYPLQPYMLIVQQDRSQLIQDHLKTLEVRLRERAAQASKQDLNQTTEALARKVPVKKILINSFAGAKLRNFSKEKTIEIIQALSRWAQDNKKPLQIISMGNAGDQKLLNGWFFSYQFRTQNPGQKLNLKSAEQIPQVSFLDLNSYSHWVRFPQVTSWNDNMALLSDCDLVITPDTAIVHAASALKKNLIAVYRQDTGPDRNQRQWAPRYTEYQVVEAPYDPRLQQPYDINTVSVQEIIEASELFL